jgi:glycosyltransferase involved in cell wall biosynthesis
MSESHPSVSVFIPTYNYGEFLPQALDSVFAQSVQPVEVIVADDGSTDNTAEIVASYGGKAAYRRFNHCGVYNVRDAVLKELKGEWFMNLDADDRIGPDYLERALEIVARHKGDDKFAIVYPDIEHFGKQNCVREKPDFSLARLKQSNYMVMSSVVRTAAAREVGFDGQFNDGWGDYDFFISLVKRGYTAERMSTSRYHYRLHPKSITRINPELDRRERLMRRMVAKHADFFSPEEALAAIRNVSAQKALRRQLGALLKKGRYWTAIRQLGYVLAKHPSWLRTPKA